MALCQQATFSPRNSPHPAPPSCPCVLMSPPSTPSLTYTHTNNNLLASFSYANRFGSSEIRYKRLEDVSMLWLMKRIHGDSQLWFQVVDRWALLRPDHILQCGDAGFVLSPSLCHSAVCLPMVPTTPSFNNVKGETPTVKLNICCTNMVSYQKWYHS